MAPVDIPNRYLPYLIYPRMLGYTITLAMHFTNGVHMTNTFKGDALIDPDVKQFHDDQFKFLTIWNVLLQMFYAALGLSCDVLSLANEGKDTALLKTLKSIRDPVFSCMVFPFSLMIATVFWTAFTYERSLILPPSVDQLLGSTSNHVIHTAVVPVVLWEAVFRPRRTPDSHVSNLVLLTTYSLAYLILLVTSYLSTGAWLYPILNILNGTIYLYFFLGTSIITVIMFYSLQWYINELIISMKKPEQKVH